MHIWKRAATLAAAATIALGLAQAPAQASAGWTIDVDIDHAWLWPTQKGTVTVTAGQSVTGTGLVISIFDTSAAAYIKVCDMGTTCTVEVIKNAPGQYGFLATISQPPIGNAYPPPGEMNSGAVNAAWYPATLTLTAGSTNLPLGGSTTLTAKTGLTVQYSQFYIQIYDITAGVKLNHCGLSATCSVNVSQNVATTHKFMAYVGKLSAAAPPPLTQSTSQASYVTWGTNWTLSLTGPSVTSGPATFTATANQNVGLTPYYIVIFNMSNGTRIGFCPSGTTCSVSYSVPGFEKNWFVAFVSANSTALPPPSVQASSNTVSTYNQPPG